MKYYTIWILFLIPLFLSAQNQNVAHKNASTYEEEIQKQYERNIKLEYINDVYIPMDMEDAFIELENLSSPEALSYFKRANEKEASRKLHFGLGKWMMVNWNLEEGSRFSHYLRVLGVSYPDDMIPFTIISFHRYLNKKPLELQNRANVYKNIYQDEVDKKMENATEISRKKTK